MKTATKSRWKVEHNDIILWCFGLIQALIAYGYSRDKKELENKIQSMKVDNNEKFDKIDRKFEKIETGEFVESIVERTIYSEKARNYFKSIFKESMALAMAHQKKNEETPLMEILDRLERIENKVR
jgi:hypothetical protein